MGDTEETMDKKENPIQQTIDALRKLEDEAGFRGQGPHMMLGDLANAPLSPARLQMAGETLEAVALGAGGYLMIEVIPDDDDVFAICNDELMYNRWWTKTFPAAVAALLAKDGDAD